MLDLFAQLISYKSDSVLTNLQDKTEGKEGRLNGDPRAQEGPEPSHCGRRSQ